MTVSRSDPALDLPAELIVKARSFASSLEGISFAQLIALAGRLDRSRQAARCALARAEESGVHALVDGLSNTAALIDCHFSTVEGELERRLKGRGAQ